MQTVFPLPCRILACLAILLPQFSGACDYCGNTPCTCSYCETCQEKPCGCVRSKESHRSVPGQDTSPETLVPAMMKLTVQTILKPEKRVTFTEGNGVLFSKPSISGPAERQSESPIYEEIECSNDNVLNNDTAASIIASLLQEYPAGDLSCIDGTIASLAVSFVQVALSKTVQDMRASYRNILEPQGYGLCGLSSLPRDRFHLLINSLEKFLDSYQYSSYYVFTVQFNNSVNVSFFFHTMPEAFNVLVLFQGQTYMVPKPEFEKLIKTLLAKRETTFAVLDEIRKGKSEDPEEYGTLRITRQTKETIVQNR